MPGVSIDSELNQITSGEPRKPSPIRQALAKIRDWINAGIVNADIASGAAIDPSKIDFGDTGAQSTLGFEDTTTATTGITTGSDLTDLSVAVTVPEGGRRVRITGQVHFQGGTADASFFLSIFEGATQLQESPVVNRVSGNRYVAFISHIFTPSAGAHTYKLRGAISAGTTATAPHATYPDFIHVEMI